MRRRLLASLLELSSLYSSFSSSNKATAAIQMRSAGQRRQRASTASAAAAASSASPSRRMPPPPSQSRLPPPSRSLSQPPIRERFIDSRGQRSAPSRGLSSAGTLSPTTVAASPSATLLAAEEENSHAVAPSPPPPFSLPPLAPNPAFAALGLPDDVCAALAAMGIMEPTEIQATAIPAILSGGSDLLLASHTGSGKTLAYLSPVISRLRREEEEAAAAAASPSSSSSPPEGHRRQRLTRPRRPRALVLGPTRELTDQIGRVAKALGHVAKCSSLVANAGGGPAEQGRALDRGVDIVVATPARAWALAKSGALSLGDVSVCVLDEADTLCDASGAGKGGFKAEVAPLLAALRARDRKRAAEAAAAAAEAAASEAEGGGEGGAKPALPPHRACEFVLVAATVSGQSRRSLLQDFPGAKSAETASTLHRGAPGARHEFVKLSGRDRLAVLSEVVAATASKKGGRTSSSSSSPSPRRVIVFANTIASARAAAHALDEGGMKTLSVHGEVPPAERAAALEAFSSACSPSSPSSSTRILVCTDLAARGLDIGESGVDAVVNADFPRNADDYLHRAGRTARGAGGLLFEAGRASPAPPAPPKGTVISLVGGNEREKTLAARLAHALSAGQSVEGISGDRGRAGAPAAARPRPETLARRAAELLAAKNKRRGVRGAARHGGGEEGEGGGQGSVKRRPRSVRQTSTKR